MIDATIPGLVGFEMSMTVSWLELNAVTYALVPWIATEVAWVSAFLKTPIDGFGTEATIVGVAGWLRSITSNRFPTVGSGHGCGEDRQP